MRYGLVFPQKAIAWDGCAIATYAWEAEKLGFDHILATDHVIGASTASRPDWTGPYTTADPFQEPLILFAFMAAVTHHIGFASGVMILPQRQTVLFAKQAAALDVLSGGRLRLGIGTGWNPVEYQALGISFRDRGAIIDEQVPLLRKLWTQEAVSADLRFHRVDDSGLNPLPLQRPIPLWFGGGGRNPVTGTVNSGTVLRRIARHGDGWMPPFKPDEDGERTLRLFDDICVQEGRNRADIGLEGFVIVKRDDASWLDECAAWRRLGATHLAINLQHDGPVDLDVHIRCLAEVAADLELDA